METTVENINSWKKNITVKRPANEIINKVKTKIKEYAKTISVPGFRKGKVPPTFVEKKYGSSIEAEVIENEIDIAYREALKENDITPIATIPMGENDVKWDKENGLEFKITVEVEPEIVVKGYTDHNI